MRTMGHATIYHWILRDQMLKWASVAKIQIKEKIAEQTKESRAQYHRWVDSQLRLGAGALHALTKRTEEVGEEAVYIHRAKSPASIAREGGIAEEANLAKAREKTITQWRRADGGTHRKPIWRTCARTTVVQGMGIIQSSKENGAKPIDRPSVQLWKVGAGQLHNFFGYACSCFGE